MKTATRQQGNEFLALWRRKKHYTQTELAGIIGISAKTYWNYEHGKSLPPIHVFLALEEILDIPVRTLYDSFWQCTGYICLKEIEESQQLIREVVLECR